MPENLLIELLPTDLRTEVEKDLRPIDLTKGEVLFRAREALQSIYFPIDSLISEVVTLENGKSVEASTIGTDGFSGVAVLLGSDLATNTTVVQVGGTAVRMPLTAFVQHLGTPAFRDVVGGYAAWTLGVISQSAACLAFHTVQQRLARWLLMVRDGLRRDELPLTQEQIGVMLGSQRPTVTEAVQTLVRAGLIAHSRGLIRLVDSRGLEAASCECYRVACERFPFVRPWAC